MKEKLRCRILGHDFRTVSIRFKKEWKVWNVKPSDWCRNCGLAKKEAGI